MVWLTGRPGTVITAVMTTSRKIGGFAALLLLLVALAGCGGTKSHQLCVSYNGQTKCVSATQLQNLKSAVKRANKAIRHFNETVGSQP